MLIADFTRFRVWTVDPDGTQRQEWLLIHRKDLTKNLPILRVMHRFSYFTPDDGSAQITAFLH